MPRAEIRNISIKSVSCALPTEKVETLSRCKDFGKDAVEKIIKKTGVESIYRAAENQTASDLAFVAARRLLEQNNLNPEGIGALVFVSQTPDYRLPATACVLQHRLGLSQECVCYDINLGCSGYINGLYSLASIMKNSDIERALLLIGETPSKRISPLDRSLSMLFGDCGAATLLEKSEAQSRIVFGFKSFGERFKKIIVPAGGYRNRNASEERVRWADGNIRSDYDTFMNGQDVFSFSISEVPQYIMEFMEENDVAGDTYDYFILHQANQYILKQIGKKLGVAASKIPISMVSYGNTSSSSIPLTMSFLASQGIGSLKRLLLSGFGVGLSWGVADLEVDMAAILPVVHTDEYFEEGFVSHE